MNPAEAKTQSVAWAQPTLRGSGMNPSGSENEAKMTLLADHFTRSTGLINNSLKKVAGLNPKLLGL